MTEHPASVEELALSNCHREPVHVPGRIQGFGALLAFDRDTLEVTHASANLERHLGVAAGDALGRELGQALGSRELVHSVRGGLGLPTVATQRERPGACRLGGRAFDVGLSVVDRTGIVELEPVEEDEGGLATPIALVRNLMAELETAGSVDTFLASAVTGLRKLTGYDRVMAYRFLSRGEGEVVAEAVGPGLEAYLGLRYPASDIPDPVRAIMVAAPFRVIGDVADPHSELLASPGALALDLTLTQLRGVSPIHLEYLRNMGVGATMNTSLIVRGQLWGLFAFHHYRPLVLTPEHRSVCELFGHLISLQLQQKLELEVFQRRKRADSVVRSLRVEAGSSLHTVVADNAAAIAGILSGVGLALVDAERVTGWGSLPDEAALRHVASSSADDVFHTEQLGDLLPDGADSELAGAMVMTLAEDAHLVVLREEIIQHVRWAGGGEKRIEFGPHGPRLHPRSSFAEYRESVTGHCEPWTEADVSAAIQLRATLRELALAESGSMRAEWTRQRRHQDLLIAELNHRVKNLLALVRSIAAQTRASSTSVEQYAKAFEQRIHALSNAHDLVGGSGIQWAHLDDLLLAELRAFAQSSEAVTVQGPPLALRADAAPLMALVFHELASNAVKHGALSEQGEGLSVSWRADAGGVTIEWLETVRRPLEPAGRRGFGLALIERAVPHELGGECELELRPEGLRARFWLPNQAIQRVPGPRPATAARPTARRESGREASGAEPRAAARRGDRTALVLEDNLVLAMEMESLLTRHGFSRIHSFGRIPDCRRALEEGTLEGTDVAVLDVNLGGETSFELARSLRSAGVPVILVSGYGSNIETPAELADLPRLRKPVDEQVLERVLATVLEGGA